MFQEITLGLKESVIPVYGDASKSKKSNPHEPLLENNLILLQIPENIFSNFAKM